MKFEELVILLPCHSLEDFPVHHEGTEAESLLAAWSVMWHPALLASCEKLPTWYRADGPPDDLAGRLILIPPPSESLILAGFAARARSEGAHVVRKLHRRDEMLAAALAELDGGDRGVEAQLAADFLALGTCYLLVELLTRQMRYMSNVDEVHLRNETLAAAQAAVGGDGEAARTHLKNCFEVLTEARERFYPVNAYLVDLTLVAATTLGPALLDELAWDAPKNLLMSGEVLEQLAREAPATLASLRLALDHKSADVVGGEYAERELPLLPPELILAQLKQGLATHERILGTRPAVYGRRRSGLTPTLPQILSRLGIEGALHFTLDDGQFPTSDQCKTRWEGLDSSAIDALCRAPLDARLAETFLGLPRKMGESMDTDHVATVLLAHWPGQSSVFYDDLRRMAAYGPVFGKFITLAEYFAHTDRPGELTRFKPDQYRTPYLRQAIIRQQPDALSRHITEHRHQWHSESARTLGALVQLLTGRAELPAEPSPDRQLADAIGAQNSQGHSGCVVINAASYGRRMLVEMPNLAALPNPEGAVIVAQESAGRKFALIDVPGCGFAWFRAGDNRPAKPGKPLAEENVLRNEFFEVSLHAETGGIRSIYVPGQRGNRLSQQLAFRLPVPRPQPGDLWRDPDETAVYSQMRAERIEITAAGPAFGEIVSHGQLVDPEGKRLAGFRQRFQLVRGSRVLRLEIELDVDEIPRADPWNSYYAARFAWSDPAVELWRSVGWTAQPTAIKRLEAPHFVELRDEKNRTAIFTGGLPYHRFNGDRKLDTLLVVRGESQRRFTLGIGIDAAHPMQEALELFDEPSALPVEKLPATASGSSWLFHLDTRNVVATHWEAICEGGVPVGVRARLLETEGRAGRTWLRTFRTPQSARQVDFQERLIVELPIENDRVGIDFSASEWIEVEVRW